MIRSKKNKLKSKKKAKDIKIILLFLTIVPAIIFSMTYKLTRDDIEKHQDENKVEASELVNRMLEKNKLEGIK